MATKEYHNAYYHKKILDPDWKARRNQNAQKWRQYNHERSKEIQRESRNKIKQEVYKLLGNSCICCGINDSNFLSIDHRIKGDGPIEFQRTKNGIQFFRRIISMQDEARNRRYRLLCMNCNHAIGRVNSGGICPHSIIKASFPC